MKNSFEDKILIVLVLYKTPLSESVTYKSVTEYNKRTGVGLKLYIYDNSPFIQEYNQGYFNQIEYINDVSNPGIAQAYNQGLEFCIKQHIPWLLLLDQDSKLNDDFFDEMKSALHNHGNNKNTASFIPKIFSGSGNPISPMVLKKGGIARSLPNPGPGFQPQGVTALNSGTLLRVSFLEEIGGFNKAFPLDMLDHWLFRKIHEKEHKIFLTNATMQHDLSVLDFEKNMTIDRYEKLLVSERLFLKGKLSEQMVYKIRLVIRMLKQLHYKEKGFLLLTLREIFR